MLPFSFRENEDKILEEVNKRIKIANISDPDGFTLIQGIIIPGTTQLLEEYTSGFAKQEEVTFLKWLMIGIIIVLALALGGFLTNTEAERKASYSDLQKQIQDQNTQIQILTNQIKNSTVIPKQ
jgi:hypothetical protein